MTPRARPALACGVVCIAALYIQACRAGVLLRRTQRRSKVYTKAARNSGRPSTFTMRVMTTQHKPIAVYYEHPEWFRALFEELDRRGTPYVRIDASRHRYDPSADESRFALLFNRMSASAYLRGHGNAI